MRTYGTVLFAENFRCFVFLSFLSLFPANHAIGDSGLFRGLTPPARRGSLASVGDESRTVLLRARSRARTEQAGDELIQGALSKTPF